MARHSLPDRAALGTTPKRNGLVTRLRVSPVPSAAEYLGRYRPLKGLAKPWERRELVGQWLETRHAESPLPTYLSQGDLSPYYDPLPKPEEVLFGRSQGGHRIEIATGHPASYQPGPFQAAHQGPSRCRPGSGRPSAENPAGQVEAALAARPRSANRSVEAER